MADMLVALYRLPDDRELVEKLKSEGINIRRVHPYEISILRDFVRKNFGEGWADEAMNAFSHQPPTCFIATHEKKIVGFAAYECTARNFFGPTGVKPEYRNKGIGKALLIASLKAQRELGYGYAIIGSAGPVDYYAKTVGAIEIADSKPGIYVDGVQRSAD